MTDRNDRQFADFNRRDFIKLAASGTVLGLSAMGRAAGQTNGGVDVWVLHGTDKTKLMAECMKVIDANGGLGKTAKSLALKVNAAWARTPELGATTHPELVAAFIRGAKAAGITTVDVPENPCNRAEQAFSRSGIQDAVKEAGGNMIDMSSEKKYFADAKFPKGKSLTSARVTKHFLEADCVVNMPVAKHHRAAELTMAMKNWMGAVEDRGFWHRSDLHQCIADFSTLVTPTWTIIDATRVMLFKGPQGGSLELLKKPNPDILVVSRDQVAADAYSTVFFGKKPADIHYLQLAQEMGLGVTDPAAMNVHTIEVPA